MESILRHYSCLDNLSQADRNETYLVSRLLLAGSWWPTLVLSSLALPCNIIIIILVILLSHRRPEGAIHVLLQACADLLFSLTPWVIHLFSYLNHRHYFCHAPHYFRLYEHVAVVTVTQNRWMTFYLTFQRFLGVFVFKYSLRSRSQTAAQNVRHFFRAGFLCGLGQGAVGSLFLFIEREYFPLGHLRDVIFNVHSILFTGLVTLVSMATLVRLRCLSPSSSKSFCNRSRFAAEYGTSIVAVAFLHVGAQLVTIVYHFGQFAFLLDVVTYFRARWTCLSFNSTVNVFLYCTTSSVFRSRVLTLFRLKSSREVRYDLRKLSATSGDFILPM